MQRGLARLVEEFGDLDEVWTDDERQAAFLAMPLEAMQVGPTLLALLNIFLCRCGACFCCSQEAWALEKWLYTGRQSRQAQMRLKLGWAKLLTPDSSGCLAVMTHLVGPKFMHGSHDFGRLRLLCWFSSTSQLLRHGSTRCRSSCQPPSCECPQRTQVGRLGLAVRWDLAVPTALHVNALTRPTQSAWSQSELQHLPDVFCVWPAGFSAFVCLAQLRLPAC